jgi:RNA polymerase sigma-70 factor (ECF subfamily)
VLGYLRAHGVPDAEDVLGDVFVQVVRDLGRFRGDEAALRRWVFSIAHNRMVDWHRRRRRREAALAAVAGDRREPARDPDGAVVDPALVAALAALTPLQREVVVLRFVADLPLADVARVVRRPVGAVKALQHRALARLARALG